MIAPAVADWSWAKKSSTPKPFAYDKKAAQRAMGDLIRTRTTEYDKFYSPVASRLSALATSTPDLEAAKTAGARGGRIFDAGVGAMEREQRGLGVGPMAGQAERFNLRRMLSEVDSANRSLEGQNERRSIAQIFATDQYGDLMSNAGQVYTNLSGVEQNRQAQYAGARAGANSSAMGAAGAAVGIIASMV